MNRNISIAIRYEITTYRSGGEVETKSMTAEELKTVNVQAYDHLFAPAWGVYGYRRPDGEWIERPIDASGIGSVGQSTIQALQLNPGVFLTPKDIAELTGNWNLNEPNALAARLTKIRAAHGEDGDHQRFFVSRRNAGYALKWPVEYSWIWIERIPDRPTT